MANEALQVMDSERPIRLFLATPLPPTGHVLIDDFFSQHGNALADRLTPLKCRMVPPENRHLTWLFLGEVLPAMCETIIASLTRALAGQTAPTVTLSKVSLWPPRKKLPRLIVWEGEPTPAAAALFDTLCQALPQFSPDHAFRPHITLARLSPPREQDKARSSWAVKASLSLPSSPLFTFPLSDVRLVQSTLLPGGAVYQDLQQWPLAPP